MVESIDPRLILLCFLLAISPATGQEVSGFLRDVTGSGISNVMVRADLFDSIGSTQLVARTDAAGRFSFPSQEGSWVVQLEASDLNALGYPDVTASSFSVSNNSRSLYFTTHKLDLSRRIVGHLVDDAQWPRPGIALRAFITENGQRFETNVLSRFDGGFSFSASPALWRIEQSPAAAAANLLFPELDVPVEATNTETPVTIVAPRATSTITGVASNLAGFNVIAECEAFGTRYVQSANLWPDVRGSSSAFSLPVFNGVWKVSIGDQFNPSLIDPNLPQPVIVHVTNQTVTVQFDRPTPPTKEVLLVKVVAVDGTSVTNASVNASSELGIPIPRSPPLPQFPGSPPPDPTVKSLSLGNGGWTISAGTYGLEVGLSWSVSRDVTVPLNGASNLSLVIPKNGIGPRITGVVRDTHGVPLPGRYLQLKASTEGTNYSGAILTEINGRFALHVVPGQWVVTMADAVACEPGVRVEITTGEQEVELVVCPFPSRTSSLIAVDVEDEAGIPETVFGVSLSGGSSYYSTNLFAGQRWATPLSTGLWTASLFPDWSTFHHDPYRILPVMKFQHPGADSTNLSLVARRSSARIEGRLRDARGKLLNKGYATARANIGGRNYSVSGQVASGYFSLHVIPGDWQVAASTWRSPTFGGELPSPISPGARPTPDYIDPPAQWLSVTNGVNNCEFVTEDVPASVSLMAMVVGENGIVLKDTTVQIPGNPFGEWQEVDSHGIARFTILPGLNTISASPSWRVAQWEQLLFPTVSLNLTAPSNYVVLIVRAPTACLHGTVSDQEGSPLAFQVSGNGQVQGTNYSSVVCPDFELGFCLPVIPGDWVITVPDGVANGLGFQSPRSETVLIPATGLAPSVDFVLEPFAGDFRNAQWSTPSRKLTGGLELELRAQATLTWRIDRSDDLKTWSAWSTAITTNGAARLFDPDAPSGRSKYYRAVWIQ